MDSKSKANYFVAKSLAEGFADDCDELIQRCLQSENLNFHVFCNIWKDMQFAFIFQGRNSPAETAEFCEEAIYIAKRYMVSPSNNFEEQVAGLFIVYALLNLQPFPRFATLRLTAGDVSAVHSIEDSARRLGRCDVLYVLGSVLLEGGTEFQLVEVPHGLDLPYRKSLEVHRKDYKVSYVHGLIYRQDPEFELLRELDSLAHRYTLSKDVADDTKPERNLRYHDESVYANFTSSLKQIMSGMFLSGVQPKDENQRGTQIESIKKKAMQTIGKTKHNVSVYDRMSDIDDLAISGPDIKTIPGKVKSGSPRKPMPTSSPQKKQNKDLPFIASPKTNSSASSPNIPKINIRSDTEKPVSKKSTVKSDKISSQSKETPTRKGRYRPVPTNPARKPISRHSFKTEPEYLELSDGPEPVFRGFPSTNKTINRKRKKRVSSSESSESSDISLPTSNSDDDVSLPGEDEDDNINSDFDNTSTITEYINKMIGNNNKSSMAEDDLDEDNKNDDDKEDAICGNECDSDNNKLTEYFTKAIEGENQEYKTENNKLLVRTEDGNEYIEIEICDPDAENKCYSLQNTATKLNLSEVDEVHIQQTKFTKKKHKNDDDDGTTVENEGESVKSNESPTRKQKRDSCAIAHSAKSLPNLFAMDVDAQTLPNLSDAVHTNNTKVSRKKTRTPKQTSSTKTDPQIIKDVEKAGPSDTANAMSDVSIDEQVNLKPRKVKSVKLMSSLKRCGILDVAGIELEK